MSSLLSLPLFAQKQITEIRVIDSEKESVIESATLQWRALGSSLYMDGTTTDRKGIARVNAVSGRNLC